VTLIKVGAVVLSLVGVICMTVGGNGNDHDDDAAKKAKLVQTTTSGVVFLLLSAITYGMWEGMYLIIGNKLGLGPRADPKASRLLPIADSALFLGCIGPLNLVFIGALLPLWNLLGFEAFEWPMDGAIWQGIAIEAAMDGILNVALLAGIVVVSPLFMALGGMLCVPAGAVSDALLRSSFLTPLAYVGTACVLGSFVVLTVAMHRSDVSDRPPLAHTVGGDDDLTATLGATTYGSIECMTAENSIDSDSSPRREGNLKV
jgi:drug/metabolite transporter (DMT)-like permease